MKKLVYPSPYDLNIVAVDHIAHEIADTGYSSIAVYVGTDCDGSKWRWFMQTIYDPRGDEWIADVFGMEQVS